MKSLYRKYRPLKLSDVVGQPQVTEPLIGALKTGRIAHAYLFVGPRGCGKTSVARILAHEVNNFKYEVEDDYVDIIEIDGASNRGIDNIRELREKVMIAPTAGKYKIYIIDEVHMLTKEAFNALLKTLEEPPQHAIFIMATTDAYKVPVTITSRAQTYTFKLADQITMINHLKDIAKKEKINITDEALNIIVKKGGGSFRDSLSLLDQISTLSDQEITKESVISALGLPQDEKVTDLLHAYTEGDVVKLTTELKDLLSSGIKAETLAEELITDIVSMPTPELLPLLARLPDIKSPYAEARLLVALTSNSSVDAHTQSKPTASVAIQSKPTLRRPSMQSTKSPKTPDVPASPDTDKTPTSPQSPASDYHFDWAEYIGQVRDLSDAVYSQLTKTQFEFDGITLHIYPMKRVIKTILSKDNNKRILVDAAHGNVKITIHDENDTPNDAKKDKTLNELSDIMGGEVQDDRGGNPFE